ncbi:hypothetical protein C8Q80DRAFT_731233 [Daedaleopsis nitida]|nr:hypothetical protein C8Q80DRAFT_731233 [Daedaleopsis nitida]
MSAPSCTARCLVLSVKPVLLAVLPARLYPVVSWPRPQGRYIAHPFRLFPPCSNQSVHGTLLGIVHRLTPQVHLLTRGPRWLFIVVDPQCIH